MSNPALPLDGKKALVLGAGTPAGRRIAVALAEAGADVAVASASLDGAAVMACRRTRRAVEQAGRRSAEYAFDVTLGQNVQVSTRQVAKEMDGLDILVWAVHAPLVAPLETVSEAQWSRALSVNLTGAFFACRAAVREMLPRGWGRMLLITQESYDPWAEHAAMRTAQWGLLALTHVLAEEFGGRGVSTHSIGIDAPYAGLTADPDEWGAEWPHEVGALAVYLSSPTADDMNGNLFVAQLAAQSRE